MAQFPFKDFITSWKNGKDKALKIKGESQLLGVDENGNEVPLKVDSEGRVITHTTLTGSLTVLSTQEKPTGEFEGQSLFEHNPDTLENRIYKWISGDWRPL